MNTRGLTLIEILVGSAALLLLVGAAFSLQSSTQKFAQRSNQLNERLQGLDLTASYLADRLRAAGSVQLSGNAPMRDGTSSTCNRADDLPCISVRLPVLESATAATTCGRDPGTVIGWTQTAYRFVKRSSLAENERRTSAVLDEKGYALLEITAAPTTSACSAPVSVTSAPAPTISAATVSSGIIADNLAFPEDSAGKVFTVTTGAPTYASGALTNTRSSSAAMTKGETILISLVALGDQNGKLIYTPLKTEKIGAQIGAYQVSAQPRNLP